MMRCPPCVTALDCAGGVNWVGAQAGVTIARATDMVRPVVRYFIFPILPAVLNGPYP